jgi:HECT-domain (ubiquitin-transferase)
MSDTSSYLHVSLSDDKEAESHGGSNGWEEVQQQGSEGGGSVGGSHPSNAECGEESEGSVDASQSSSDKSNATEDEWEDVQEASGSDPNKDMVVLEFPPDMRSPLPPARAAARRRGNLSCASSLTRDTSARNEPTAARAHAAAAAASGTGGYRSETSDLESIQETATSSYCGRLQKLTMKSSHGDGDSYTSYAGDELTTSSETAISRFSCLDVSGSSLIRCKKCTTLNQPDKPIMLCESCDRPLSNNPCIEADAETARCVQEREETGARAALKLEERKRRDLSERLVFERADVLKDDINNAIGVALQSANSDDVLPLPDLIFHAADMIEHFGRVMRPVSIPLYYYFCPEVALGDVRKRLKEMSVKVSADVDAAIGVAKNENAMRPTARVPPFMNTLFPIQEHRPSQDHEYIGLLVVVVDESPVERNERLSHVTAPSRAYPLVAFRASIRGTDVVQELRLRLRATCEDYFLTDWKASSQYNLDEHEASAKKLKRSDSFDADESNVDPIPVSVASATGPGDQASTSDANDLEIVDFLGGVDLFLEDRLPPGDLATSADAATRERASLTHTSPHSRTSRDDFQELEMPQGAQPGQAFIVVDGVLPVLVAPPPSSTPGSKFDVKKPFGCASLLQLSTSFHIGGERTRWVRLLRVSDLGFQWVCVNEHGLQVNEDDARVRCWGIEGDVSLVPASQVVFAGPTSTHVSNVAKAALLDFPSKKLWFLDMCATESRGTAEEFHHLHVRRHALLDDLIPQVMSMGPSELKKEWRTEFVGDVADGPTDLLSTAVAALLDPNIGLWKPCAWNDKVMEINPESRTYHGEIGRRFHERFSPNAVPLLAGSWEEECGTYYRFFGRIIGKALAEGRELDCHLAPYILKHLVGCPVTLRDVKEIDRAFYHGIDFLQTFAAGGNDVSMLSLDFTTTFGCSPGMDPIELVSGGAAMSVTNENLPDYLVAAVTHRLFGFAKLQITSLLFGVLDVVPEYLMGVLDPLELELRLCGIPQIDVEDWKANTEYTADDVTESAAAGGAAGCGRVYHWFWQIVESYDNVDRARLLQLVTGTCAIPTGGFAALRASCSTDANANANANAGIVGPNKFTLRVVAPPAFTSDADEPQLPRADRTRSRLDLPMVGSLSELQTKLAIALKPSVTPAVL